MGTIRVKVNPHADSGSICQDLLAAALAATGKPATAAEVIRDGNGKVVEVLVGLPDVDAQGLVNAEAKMNENSGVANNGTTVSPDLITDEDFEGFSAGTEITTITSGTGLARVQVQTVSRDAEMRASESVDAIAGSVSLICSDLNTTESATFNSLSPQIQWNASDNGVTDMGAFECSFTVQRPLTENGVAKDIGNNNFRTDIQVEASNGGLMFGRVRAIGTAASIPNWSIDIQGASPEDTGVPVTSPLSVVVKYDLGGKATIKAAGKTVTRDYGFVTRGPQRLWRGNIIDVFSSAAIYQVAPTIIDDLKFDLLS